MRNYDIRNSKYKVLKKLFAFLLILLIFSGVAMKYFTQASEAAWFDNSFSYRQSVAIANTGSSVSDYQVSFTLNTSTLISAGKMLSTCNDIRVIDQNGKQLPLWIETGSKACNTTTTAIWTKVSSLPAGGVTLYVYYGNPSAQNIQSGDKVFEFFDDFSGGTLNGEKWTTGTISATVGTDFTVGGGVLSGGNSNRYVQSSRSFTGDYIAETRENTNTQVVNGFSTVGFWATSSNNFGILDHNSTSYYRNDAGWVNFSYNGTGQWNRDKVKVVGTSAVYYRTGETSGSSTNTATNSGISGEYLRIGARYDGGTYNQNFVATWDWIFVRKAVATEPSAASPASEEKGPSPVAYWKFDGNLFDQTINKNHAVAGMSSLLTPNYVDGVSGSAIDFTTSDWSTNLSYVSSTVVQDSTKSWTTDQWAGYTLVSNYEAVGGYCRRLIVSNTATNLTLNGTCNSWAGTKTYRIKKVMWVQDAVNYGTTNVTVESWYRRTASKADSNNTLVRFSGDDVGIEVYDTYITGYVDGYVNGFNCTVAGTDKKWHHVSITYDGATVNLYYDGKLCNTRSQVSTLSNNETVMIGTRNDGYSAFFEGYVDDFKIYPYTRSTNEIKADFNNRGSGGASTSVLGSASNNNNALSNGLVGYWKMDESSWNGTASEVRDASGNGNNGTSGNGAATGGGKFGNGGVFDGINDYVSVADNTSQQITNNFTIGTWVKASSTSQSQKYFVNKGNFYAILYEYVNDTVEFFSGAGKYTGTDPRPSSAITLADTNWHHIVYTYDGKTFAGYKDGVQIFTTQITFSINSSASNVLYLGAASTSANAFGGSLDDFRIYNRALSSYDISNLYNLAPGPVGYWNLDEKSGTTASDISGNGNTGTWSGTGNHFVSGKVGGAGSFDGSSDSISIPDTSALNPSAISVSTWFKPTSTLSGLDVGLISKWNAGVNDGWFIELGSSGANARVYTLGLSTVDWQPTLPVLSAGTWYHLEFTYDGTTKNIYINGVLIASQASTGSLDVSDKTVKIGYSGGSGGGNHYFPGAIDETKIYNYARSAKQITEDMQGSRPAVNGRGAGTVGYWKFDEGYGTSAKDYSGNGRNATISSAIWSSSGKFGKALSFSGSNSISVADNDALDFGTNDFTISYWGNIRDYTYPKSVVTMHKGTTVYSNGFAGWEVGNGYSATSYRFGINDGTNKVTSNITLDSGFTPTDLQNKWAYFAFVVSRATGRVTLYVNGVKQANTLDISSVTGSINNSDSFQLGSINGWQIDGLVDELKMYNYALTSDDVKKDYSRGSMQVLGSVGTDASGNPSNSSDRAYCPPGDTTATCGPVGEWNFEEAQGTSVNDTSGNGNTGTISNATWVSGKIGKALSYDGTGDYVGAGNASSLQLGAGTMEAWINTSNAGSSYRAIIAKQYAYGIFLQNNIFILYDWGTGSTRTTSINLADGAWHHVAASFQSGVSNGTIVYIDGVPKLTTTMTVSNQASSLSFGTGASTANGQDFTGKIDQAKIYNYVRTPAQIAWDYNRGAPLALFKMDECEGSTVRDMTGNGNTGTITIGASGTQTTAGTCQTSGTAWGNGVNGKIGSSLNFDGTDDSIQTSKSNTPSISGSFSTWLYPDSTMTSPSGYPTLMRYNSDPGMYIQQTSGKPYIQVGTSGGTKACVSSKALTASTWQHIVGTYETSGANILLKVYLNGQLVCTNTQTSVTLTQTANSFSVGSALYKGQLDDVRIYNYPLTTSQIKDVYNGGAINFTQ